MSVLLGWFGRLDVSCRTAAVLRSAKTYKYSVDNEWNAINHAIRKQKYEKKNSVGISVILRTELKAKKRIEINTENNSIDILSKTHILIDMSAPRNNIILVKEYNKIIIIIMSCRQHRYPWPSLATSPYRSSLLAGLQGAIQYSHRAVVRMFVLVVLLLLGHVWGSTGVHPLCARSCFTSSIQHVWFVYLDSFRDGRQVAV